MEHMQDPEEVTIFSNMSKHQCRATNMMKIKEIYYQDNLIESQE